MAASLRISKKRREHYYEKKELKKILKELVTGVTSPLSNGEKESLIKDFIACG